MVLTTIKKNSTQGPMAVATRPLTHSDIEDSATWTVGSGGGRHQALGIRHSGGGGRRAVGFGQWHFPFLPDTQGSLRGLCAPLPLCAALLDRGCSGQQPRHPRLRISANPPRLRVLPLPLCYLRFAISPPPSPGKPSYPQRMQLEAHQRVIDELEARILTIRDSL